MIRSAIDQSYVREILEHCSATTRDAFYQGCQIDINAGYRAEVDEAWRVRSAHCEAVKARGYE